MSVGAPTEKNSSNTRYKNILQITLMGVSPVCSDTMRRTTPLMAAQERETSRHTGVVTSVGAATVVASVAVAVTVPVVVTTVAVAVAAAAVVVRTRRSSDETSTTTEVSGRPDQESHGPANESTADAGGRAGQESHGPANTGAD
jgi:hypothetical protein